MGTFVSRTRWVCPVDAVSDILAVSAAALSAYAKVLTTFPVPVHTSQTTFIRAGVGGRLGLLPFADRFAAFSAAAAAASSAARVMRSRFEACLITR
jgi:hypothetical protein